MRRVATIEVTDPPIVTDGGCWVWPGVHTKAGYGTDRGKLVHRTSYECFKGPIPKGLEIDHLCRNRGCYNPEHLEAVTHLENVLRGYMPTQTHCVNGHIKEGNRNSSGQCATCAAAHKRKHDERKRAQKHVAT